MMTNSDNQINLDRIFKSRLTASETVAVGVKKFTILPDRPFPFLPWQYVWVEIPALQFPDTHGNRRAFSIFNVINESNTIDIVARISESGYKQSLFNLSHGSEVTIHGPFGSSFTTQEGSNKNIIMIAGGVGIAAFICLIKTMGKFSSPPKCFLDYLNNSQEITPFLNELEDLKNQYNFFDYTVNYEPFKFEDVAHVKNKFGDNIRWQITGPQSMVDHAYSVLSSNNITRESMEFENFYPTPPNNLTVSTIKEQLSSDNLFARAIQYSSSHTIITDANGVVLFANLAAQKITGYTETEMVGNTPRLWGGLMNPDFYKELWKHKAEGSYISHQISNRRKNGEIYYVIAHISQIQGPAGEIIGYIATEEDISARVAFEKELEQKVAEQERLNKVMVGRELKMIELKEEIKKLKNPLTNSN